MSENVRPSAINIFCKRPRHFDKTVNEMFEILLKLCLYGPNLWVMSFMYENLNQEKKLRKVKDK